jgi:N-acetylmuramoyl-L-alanine amidase
VGQVVCIDPGHPSEVNPGYTVQNGTTETHIDWVVAQKLRTLLKDKGFRVVMTKSAEKQVVRNKERALIANRAGAAVMVRLHCDSSTSSGFALYFPDRTGTREGVTGPSAEVRERSRQAADVLEAAMRRVLGGRLRSDGVKGDSKTFVGGKQGALTGSIFSRVPVVTIEMVVLSNRSDAAFIKSAAGQELMARAIAAGIEDYLSAAPRPAEATPH